MCELSSSALVCVCRFSIMRQECDGVCGVHRSVCLVIVQLKVVWPEVLLTELSVV